MPNRVRPVFDFLVKMKKPGLQNKEIGNDDDQELKYKEYQ